VIGAIAVAAAVLWLIRPHPRAPELAAVSVRLPAPTRGEAAVVVTCPPGTPELRLVPQLPAAARVPASPTLRLRRVGGAPLAGRLEAGPPLALVVSGCPAAGSYELELAGDDGRAIAFYPFTLRP
jgi:hypothetical protein